MIHDGAFGVPDVMTGRLYLLKLFQGWYLVVTCNGLLSSMRSQRDFYLESREVPFRATNAVIKYLLKCRPSGKEGCL